MRKCIRAAILVLLIFVTAIFSNHSDPRPYRCRVKTLGEWEKGSLLRVVRSELDAQKNFLDVDEFDVSYIEFDSSGKRFLTWISIYKGKCIWKKMISTYEGDFVNDIIEYWYNGVHYTQNGEIWNTEDLDFSKLGSIDFEGEVASAIDRLVRDDPFRITRYRFLLRVGRTEYEDSYVFNFLGSEISNIMIQGYVDAAVENSMHINSLEIQYPSGSTLSVMHGYKSEQFVGILFQASKNIMKRELGEFSPF